MPVAIEGEHLPTEVGYNAELQSGLVRMTTTQMSFHETVSDCLSKNSLVVQTQFHQFAGWLVSDDPTGEKDGCGGPGLTWLHVVCGCEAG
jgi:hypothetical protein